MILRDASYDAAYPRPGIDLRGFAGSLTSVLLRYWPLWLSLAIGGAIFLRTLAVWAPEGDSALHYRLMIDIARSGSLPDHLPHHPARVGEGGVIEAMFPYSYTPLFHATGAVAYSAAGREGVMLLNALGAACIALVIAALVARRMPPVVAAAAAIMAFAPPTTLAIFTHVYMEPLMLAFVFAGAWCYYLALTTRGIRPAILAATLFALAIGTRQVALLNVAVIGLTTMVYLFERRMLRGGSLTRELRWLAPFSIALAVAAAPFLVYLAFASGTVGYGDLALPGTQPRLAINPTANAYISNITNPDLSPLHWLDRYRQTLLYSERWLPGALAALPFLFVAAGVAHMERRGGGARFFARLTVAQLLVEMTLFALLHGNDRYVVASRMFFYATLPVGVYAVSLTLVGWILPLQRYPRRLAVLAPAGVISIALGASLFGGGYFSYLDRQQDLMSLRSAAYQDAGAWVNEHTAEDSLILAPRVYSAELAFERDVTWVTFYGNAWVIDAIAARDPRDAHAILSRYGVDYVMIADPPGTYIDKMPASGMRSYLRIDSSPNDYFELAFTAQGDGTRLGNRTVEHPLRIYRVVDSAEARR